MVNVWKCRREFFFFFFFFFFVADRLQQLSCSRDDKGKSRHCLNQPFSGITFCLWYECECVYLPPMASMDRARDGSKFACNECLRNTSAHQHFLLLRFSLFQNSGFPPSNKKVRGCVLLWRGFKSPNFASYDVATIAGRGNLQRGHL